MAKIVITKAGDIIETVFNTEATDYDKVSRNTVTGGWVALIANGKGVETNVLCEAQISTDYNKIDTIDAADVDDNASLYAKLKALL